MKNSTVRRKDIANSSRLDASFYLSDGVTANRIVNEFSESQEYLLLSDQTIANVWQPNRNVLAYAGEGEEYIPYLQPYDILEYIPRERSKLSVHQNDIDTLKITEGTILQTCSGRNLGPLVIADKYLEQFIIGSDLIRIDIFDVQMRYYIFAFLSTWIGQALLHSSKTGSVVDHLSIQDVENIKIPLVNIDEREYIAHLIEESIKHFSEARSKLSVLLTKFENSIGVLYTGIKLAKGWTVTFRDLNKNQRIDAAYYDPAMINARNELCDKGGIVFSTVAEVIKPAGRYKTNYVTKNYGTPLLSGRQILQNQIVGLKYLPFFYSEKYEKFILRNGYVAYPADGRVEGRLGSPVYITDNREGWFASAHVGRIIAKDGISPGYIYLAMSHPVVQAQIRALACGSVVDSVYPEDVKNIIIPPPIDFPYEEVIEAWNLFDKAENKKQQACDRLVMLLEK